MLNWNLQKAPKTTYLPQILFLPRKHLKNTLKILKKMYAFQRCSLLPLKPHMFKIETFDRVVMENLKTMQNLIFFVVKM